MDISKMALGVFFAFVISFSFMSWMNSLNTGYAGTSLGTFDTSFSSRFSYINSTATSLAGNAADASAPVGQSTDVNSAFTQSKSTLGVMRDAVSLPITLIVQGGDYLGIPSPYISIGIAALVLSGAITLAMTLLIGARRWW